MIKIEVLCPNNEQEYAAFLLQSPDGLFYHSLKYRNILQSIISAQNYYFIAREGKEIVGALPSFLKQNNRYGHILNALPFYGSHGAVLVKDPSKGDLIKKELLEAFDSFAREKNCLIATIISSPFERNPLFYHQEWQPDYLDERVAQITNLPIKPSSAKEELDKLIHSVRRRNVRKALKSGITLQSSEESSNFEPIFRIHKENLAAMKGISKPKVFFQKMVDYMEPGRDYRLYYAERQGEIVAGLLVFYFKEVVDYYTPAVKLEYRNLQPLSLLIYESMLESINKGYRYYSFGGTWKSQVTLYQFKKHWGTKDYPYYYYIKTYGDINHIKRLSKETILQEYPWFYVIPFSELKA